MIYDSEVEYRRTITSTYANAAAGTGCVSVARRNPATQQFRVNSCPSFRLDGRKNVGCALESLRDIN